MSTPELATVTLIDPVLGPTPLSLPPHAARAAMMAAIASARTVARDDERCGMRLLRIGRHRSPIDRGPRPVGSAGGARHDAPRTPSPTTRHGGADDWTAGGKRCSPSLAAERRSRCTSAGWGKGGTR